MGYTRAYNRHAAGRAWEILGYTHSGAVYCPDCADSRFSDGRLSGRAVDYGIDNPAPIFGSDEVPSAWACDACGEIIAPDSSTAGDGSRIVAGGARIPLAPLVGYQAGR
jgi:hypothetical protein